MGLEASAQTIGHASTLLVDAQRGDRWIGVDYWYPAMNDGSAITAYELLPGVAFAGEALTRPAPQPGLHPVILLSHGWTGTRLIYSQICEALAARGFVVIAGDHPGSTASDLFLGTLVDEETNGRNRAADAQFLLDSVTGERPGFDHGLQLNFEQLAMLGHSNGVATSLAFAADQAHGPKIRAVVGMEPYVRPVTVNQLERITTPVLLLSGDKDLTTPTELDLNYALAHIATEFLMGLELAHCGHQGSSDVGLYIEQGPSVEGVPAGVLEFLDTMSADITGVAHEDWRPILRTHVELIGAWLNEQFSRPAANPSLSELLSRDGITQR